MATQFKGSWFAGGRLRRHLALALLVFASGWMIVSVITAAAGAGIYGWGSPEIIWPSIVLLALLAAWLVRQTLRFRGHSSAAQPN